MGVEHDFLGEMDLEDAHYYGIQTARGMAASQVTGRTHGQEARALIDALAQIKKAAALANCRVGGLDRARAGAIARAADEGLEGRWYGQFPVDLITGGVSLHMNRNEVLARRASELLDGVEANPNTHVNMYEDAVADAPDSGEPEAARSQLLAKLKARLGGARGAG